MGRRHESGRSFDLNKLDQRIKVFLSRQRLEKSIIRSVMSSESMRHLSGVWVKAVATNLYLLTLLYFNDAQQLDINSMNSWG